MIPTRPRNVSFPSSGPEARASTEERADPQRRHWAPMGLILSRQPRPPPCPRPDPLLSATGLGAEFPEYKGKADIFAVVVVRPVQGHGSQHPQIEMLETTCQAENMVPVHWWYNTPSPRQQEWPQESVGQPTMGHF